MRGSTTWKVTYDEDGRPYAGVYTAGTASPVTFLIATTDRGDVVALTNTAGDVFVRYTYDPYGRVLTQTSNSVTGISSTVAGLIRDRQPLRYAGYTYDAHSATYYLSQRHYDPATMRFLTKDPARDDGEESAYQYCAGDPVGRVDPSGMWSISVLIRMTHLISNLVPTGFVGKFAGWLSKYIPKALAQGIAKGAEGQLKRATQNQARKISPSFLELRKNSIGWWHLHAWTQSRTLHFASKIWQEPLNSRGKWKNHGRISFRIATW